MCIQLVNRSTLSDVARKILTFKLPLSGLTLETDKGTKVAISFRDGGYANHWMLSVGEQGNMRHVSITHCCGNFSDMLRLAYTLTKDPIFNDLGNKIEELGDLCL